ncbi:rod shape-determining protein MreC [Candidatus Omnitrophota bacterium]
MARSSKNLPFIVVCISIVSVIFLSQFFSSDSRIKILNIFRTPLKMISGSYYALRDVSNFKELSNENKILRENVSNLEKEILNLREAHLENQRLRSLLDFKESKKRKFMPSMVIARDSLGVRGAIIIDKGKRDGLRKDMAVISGNGLVGRVRETGWSISRVLLITDRDSVVSGIVKRTRDEGAVAGNMPSGLIMKYLDLDCDVKNGDKVITSGFSGVFEKGVLVGEIASIYKDVSGLYLRAVLKPEVDMMKLEEVLVIR